MKVIVFSLSRQFRLFLERHLDIEFDLRSMLEPPTDDPEQIFLLHISGMELECYEWLLKYVSGKPIRVGVCSDLPDIREMLECVRLGSKGYCNSHMAAVHYEHMLQLFSRGQSWFPPHMLEETFKLAHQSLQPAQYVARLGELTEREKQIALAVGEGKSNREISNSHDISEATVKTHLSSIFRKLEVKDRVGLVLYLKQA